ncbi:MAG: hypothetical protein K0R82_2912 [Flavipsychrobacter sp.]|jgi:osmotically-inducible protein OsmY|nr:hypothetical protein [Flavipsychrobacter sp.]
MSGKSIVKTVLTILCIVVALFVSCKGKNKDAEIQSAINSKVQTDANLAGVTTSVTDGTVTLTGSCANEACKTNAENAVKDIDGVKKVVNNIQVTPVVVSEDETLRNNVQSVTQKYEGVQADVSGGVVTLRGTVANRDTLQQLMMEVNGLQPKKVDNQLVIKNK